MLFLVKYCYQNIKVPRDGELRHIDPTQRVGYEKKNMQEKTETPMNTSSTTLLQSETHQDHPISETQSGKHREATEDPTSE